MSNNIGMVRGFAFCLSKSAKERLITDSEREASWDTTTSTTVVDHLHSGLMVD